MILRKAGNGARDPWVIRHEGVFYYCCSIHDSVCIVRSETLEGICDAPAVPVWKPEPGTRYSKNVWAPELHVIDGKCYIYVACDNGINAFHRMYVLANDSSDPLAPYTFRGQIGDKTDRWAIDATVFTYQNQLYMCWSGWADCVNVAQNLYLAKMSDPLTVSSERVMLSHPEHPWEKKGATGLPESPFINEGPCAVVRGEKVFILYSASGCWCNDYCLGMLRFDGGDIMDPANWKKLPHSVFSSTPNVKGPGHCSVLVEEGENESWLFYHAFEKDCRYGVNSAHAVAQRFTWRDDLTSLGTPEL